MDSKCWKQEVENESLGSQCYNLNPKIELLKVGKWGLVSRATSMYTYRKASSFYSKSTQFIPENLSITCVNERKGRAAPLNE